MAIAMTFRLPKNICQILAPGMTGNALKDAIKSALIDGLNQGIQIQSSEVSMNVQTERFNFSVNETHATLIRAIEKKAGLSPRQVCQGILLSMAARCTPAKVEVPEEFQSIISELSAQNAGVSIRSEQVVFYKSLIDSLDNGFVGLCEAGTGTGKTLAMLAAAKFILDKHPETRVPIACPSIMLMEQFARQYDQMINAGIEMPSLRVVVGRREFVSPSEVEKILMSGSLDEHVDISAVKKWLEQGGAPHESHWIRHNWLKSSLEKIAPTFPADAATLPDAVEKEDLGFLEYKKQFKISGVEVNSTHEIILCTHSMLAVDIRRKLTRIKSKTDYDEDVLADIRAEISEMFASVQDLVGDVKRAALDKITELKEEYGRQAAQITEDVGHLPPYHFLLVDEVHMLEQNFSNAMSNYVSLYAFLQNLKKYKTAGGKITMKSLDYIAGQVKRITELAREDSISLHDGSQAALHAADVMNEISAAAAIVASEKSNNNPLLMRLKHELTLISMAGKRLAHSRAYLNFSPVRKFPQLYIGAPTVDHALRLMWAGCRGAACVSATLYIPREDGFSSAYQAGLLAVPKERWTEYPPVAPEWTFSTIDAVVLPEKATRVDGTIWLRPPSRADKADEKIRIIADSIWVKEVAEAVVSIYDESPGGVLLLATSYGTIEALSELLPDEIRLNLVKASRDTSLATQRTRFLSLANAGKKPLWLAVGNAWTGLDVGGHKSWAELFGEEIPASEDNVLTTLIIPRLPFGTNRTVTHLARIERRKKGNWEVMETFFRTKQGIGRLVRREGLPANRRIYILDGRLNDPEFGGYLSRFKALVKGYAQGVFKQRTD